MCNILESQKNQMSYPTNGLETNNQSSSESMAFTCEEDPIEPPAKRKPPVANKPENACSIIEEKSQSSEKVVMQVSNKNMYMYIYG